MEQPQRVMMHYNDIIGIKTEHADINITDKRHML